MKDKCEGSNRPVFYEEEYGGHCHERRLTIDPRIAQYLVPLTSDLLRILYFQYKELPMPRIGEQYSRPLLCEGRLGRRVRLLSMM